MTIYLMGLRGCGKSTVGRLLATRLGGEFVDLDDLTPGVLGCTTAAQALRQHGEPAFRRAERQALDEPRVLGAAVVALGGGTPTAPGAQGELQARALKGDRLIYLCASPATLRQNLAKTDMGQRPSLTGAHPLDEIEVILERRDPMYRALATSTIEVDDLTPEQVVQLAIGPGK